MLRANYTNEEKKTFQICGTIIPTRELGVTLRFLPSCLPNLNLIEQLWKFVKKKCLYNIYYETFDDFKAGINACFNRVETDYKSELESLMLPNFQNLKTLCYWRCEV